MNRDLDRIYKINEGLVHDFNSLLIHESRTEDRAKAAESRASALEAERDEALEKAERAEAKLLAAELHPSDLERKLFDRASALEVLLAECGTALKTIVDQIEDYEHINNLSPNPGRQYCWDSVAAAHALLAKLKARTEPRHE